VNGLGERAGNAPMEEVVMALLELGGYKKRIDPPDLIDLCHLISKASGRVISDSKPIIGSQIFTHKSGIHCSGLLKNPSSYQLFQPGKIGKNRCEYVIRYHTGSSAIGYVLE
jgi:homocitrate synthase NifV